MNPTPLICTAPDHYSRGKHPRILALAVIPPSAFISTHEGFERFEFPSPFRVITTRGTAMEARINGGTRTWKTRPRIEVPCKLGFRECFTLVSTDGQSWNDEVPYRVLSASDDQEPKS